MYLIIGLGNPGAKYENARHNLGFRVIEELAARLKVKGFKPRCKSLVAETKLLDHKIILAEPQTFMNNSGEALSELLAWYKVNPQKMILIYDDVDLPIGLIRVRDSGSSGGHHGVDSILQHAKSQEFVRVRIGIGRDDKKETAEYVLESIPIEQSEPLAKAVIQAADAVEILISSTCRSFLSPALYKPGKNRSCR